MYFIRLQSKCTSETIENLQKWLKDGHAPLRFRVNGPLVNSSGFRKAFNCRLDPKMVSKDQCQIW